MAVAVYPINIDSRVSDFIAKPRQMLIDGSPERIRRTRVPAPRNGCFPDVARHG